jgi:hypothetical protein
MKSILNKNFRNSNSFIILSRTNLNLLYFSSAPHYTRQLFTLINNNNKDNIHNNFNNFNNLNNLNNNLLNHNNFNNNLNSNFYSNITHFSTSSTNFSENLKKDLDKKELFKKGEAFANLEFDYSVLNLSSDAHYLQRIARIMYNPDLTLEKKQFYIEENLLNYYNDHFNELLNSNPDNFKYSPYMFKLIHEHYPKFKKQLNILLKSTTLSRKAHLNILLNLNIETICSKTFITIISNISNNKISFVDLTLELGKAIRNANARKMFSDKIEYKNALNEINNEDVENKKITTLIGSELVHLFMDSTELIKKVNEKVGINDTDVVIYPTNDLSKIAMELGYVKDLLLPMIIPPINWEIDKNEFNTSDKKVNGTEIKNGMYLLNYRNDRFLEISFIKKSKDNYGKTMVSPEFIDNINRLAVVPFKINIEV